METFTNGSMECAVLKRQGDLALIARINNKYEPFVVPGHHLEGQSHWDWGHYFSTIDAALAYFNEKAKKEEEII